VIVQRVPGAMGRAESRHIPSRPRSQVWTVRDASP
jgi:hypothetical protein